MLTNLPLYEIVEKDSGAFCARIYERHVENVINRAQFHANLRGRATDIIECATMPSGKIASRERIGIGAVPVK